MANSRVGKKAFVKTHPDSVFDGDWTPAPGDVSSFNCRLGWVSRTTPYRILRAGVFVVLITLGPPADSSCAELPRETVRHGIEGIVAAFDQFPVVVIGESHGVKQAGDFYVSLVRNSEFAAKVDDIVVEFGSQRSQPIVDRYIRGEDVPPKELAQVWRNTTKTLSWESPIYPALLTAVRDVNRRSSSSRRLRVLAGDAPIDWSRVHSHADWAAFQPNDVAFSDIILLGEQARRKVLVILGGNHVTKGGSRDLRPNTTTRVNAKFPGSMFIVLLHTGASAAVESQMAAWPVPALVSVAETRLATLPHAQRLLGDTCDAILYLGPGRSLKTAQANWEELDADYLQEVDRRHQIQFGCPLNLSRWKRGQRPCP